MNRRAFRSRQAQQIRNRSRARERIWDAIFEGGREGGVGSEENSENLAEREIGSERPENE